MLEIFRKKDCSFCGKSIYKIPEKITFNNTEIEISFCEKCNLMTPEEKAVVAFARIIKKHPDMDINEIFKGIMTKDE